ncbi:pilus assembly protein PilM [Desulfosarcina sp. OttesenSCG-928-G17]|nr:pilus assembly protein PilM [Desulfosarcina sp. OttesenSCG-928-G17]
MVFQKKDQLVGLDIGSRFIKVAEISDTRKGRFLEHFGIIDIPHGTIEDGVIKDADPVASAIRQLFKKFDIKNQNVAIAIGGHAAIIKTINVPPMPARQLQSAIPLEAEQYIPFDLSEVYLDYQKLGERETRSDPMDVLLVAAKKEIVDDYVSLVQMAGLVPCIVDVDAFALQNLYEHNFFPDEDQHVVLIDVGAGKMSLNILKGRTSVFMRDVFSGCRQINQAISSLTGCSIDDAERIKSGDFQGRITESDFSEIVFSVVSEWCAEIRRALDFFYATYRNDPVENIILSGGGENIKEFKELLAVETSAKVSPINSFSGFCIDEKRFDMGALSPFSSQAAISMGLAIRKVDDK